MDALLRLIRLRALGRRSVCSALRVAAVVGAMGSMALLGATAASAADTAQAAKTASPALPADAASAASVANAATAAGALTASSSTLAPGTAVRVTFEIDMREEIRAGRFDPAKDPLGVRGGARPLSWDQPLLARPAMDERDGVWVAEAVFERLPPGGYVPYKFRVERPGQGPGEGWETGPNRSLELVAQQVQVARAFNAPDRPISLSRAGRIDLLKPLPARHVAARSVQVWLPPGYEQSPERRYPVLYLHDGQNVFDAAAAGAEWQVDETAQALVVAGEIQPLIIVAVSNSPQRIDDYTPTRASVDGQPAGGKGPAYARYLIEQLKPEIDRRYRTRPDAASTAVGGSSLGGLISLWLALHHGDVFGAALVVSPSLWWDGDWALRDAARAPLPMSGPRPTLWLDMGSGEGAENVRRVRQLRQQLFNRGWTKSSLHYLEAAGAGHDEGSWAARVEPMLRFLDRQAWPAAGRAAPPKAGQDPFPPAPPVDLHRPWNR